MTRRFLAITLGVALAGIGTVALAGRDSSGTMSMTSVAGGYPFVSGQTISSNGMNANFAEVISELSDSASRSGKGAFTAPVRTAAGTAALPAFSFSTDTNTGIYATAADSVGVSAGGSLRLTIDTTGALFTDPVSFAGSTTTTGIARFPGTISGSTTFNDPVTFAGSTTTTGIARFVASPVVPTPTAATQAASKGYVDGRVARAVADITGTGAATLVGDPSGIATVAVYTSSVSNAGCGGNCKCLKYTFSTAFADTSYVAIPVREYHADESAAYLSEQFSICEKNAGWVSVAERPSTSNEYRNIDAGKIRLGIIVYR